MFDSHLDDLIEKRVMNDEQNVSSLNSRSGLIKPPISRGLKDLIVHPPSSSSSPSSASSPLSPSLNKYGHSTANSSNNSSTSSISGTPLPLKRNTTTTTTNANSSSIKFANRRDQSLREVLDDWRTDFYPNLSYDHFYEGALKNSTSTTSSSNNNNNNSGGGDGGDGEENKDEDDEDSNSVNSNSNSDNEDDSDGNNDTKNNDAHTQYNEYINNLNDHKSSINNNQQESLLEQRVKKWKSDILLDIQQSSAAFMNQLPHRIFEKSSPSDELPMTSSTKNEPSDDQQQSSTGAGKSKFEMWRESFNTSMDEKMKEKKRTNKIIITSNKK